MASRPRVDFCRVDFSAFSAKLSVIMAAVERVRIYQLFVRQFGNTNETRKPNGTLAENGVGKFSDLNAAALRSLRAMGFTHLWLMGVLRQATGTDYSAIGLPADDPDLLKGLAGSPYAIRDYFDVCPDYADAPAKRLDEFRMLVTRIDGAGLKVILDFVPNHVARSHRSVVKPELSFGAHDDRSRFFAPDNNFYYLLGQPPLRLPTVQNGQPVSPTCRVTGGCDGRFDGESDHAKVTGNNVTSHAPGLGDWYETVKLNYGHDFSQGRHGPREFPTAEHPDKPIPDTWHKMDAVLAHWQGFGVDGFRCDMAHMVPMEFWRWAIAQARTRQAGTSFFGEAYDDDPAKLTDGNVFTALVEAGFDAVYDHHSYKILKEIYGGPKWANDLDGVLETVAPLHASVRYAENHDEVRIASPHHWGGLGPAVGRPVSALLLGIGRGPVLIYNGQEVGEPAQGAEGFGGDDARTSIFDYWSMPELTKWVNGHRYDGGRLSAEQRELRAYYSRLLALLDEPAFRDGEFIPLNGANNANPRFGRLPGEPASGHWLYAYLRHDLTSGQTFLVVVNLHRSETLRDVRVQFPASALGTIGVKGGNETVEFGDRLSTTALAPLKTTGKELKDTGLAIPHIPALSALYLEPQ